MIKKLSLIFFVLFNYILHSQETNIPDAAFETYLETHDANGNTVGIGDATSMGNGIANDKFVTTTNISEVTMLNVSNQNISNLTGVEGFGKLQVLNTNSNTISAIDLSANVELRELYIVSNRLSTLNLVANINLQQVDVSDNNLTYFDVRNANNGLIHSLKAPANYELFCINVDDSELPIITLWNVDNYTSFDEDCGQTYIPDDNFEAFLEANNMGNGILNDNYVFTVKIKNITALDISNQNIISLEGISAFESLSILKCDSNDIIALDLSMNLELTDFSAVSNDLIKLDLTANTKLLKVDVADNKLTYFDMRNGNNGFIQSFRAVANYSLTCVNIDDITLSSLALWNKDSVTSFSENCGSYVPDDNFENYLETHNAAGAVVAVGDATSMGNGIANDNYVATTNIDEVLTLGVRGIIISDLTGIEDFIALQYLDCSKNSLTNLDVSKNINLIRLQCRENLLKELDVSKNTRLEELRCSNNKIESLNITKNIDLLYLYCADNLLSSINVLENTKLIGFSCYENELTNLNVTKNIVLEDLDCVENKLTSIDLTQNIALKTLQCYDNELTILDVSKNTKLEELYCASNKLVSLDVTQNIVLEDLECENNPLLASLNVRNGNNVNLSLQVNNSPNLYCILVDDASASYVSSWRKDAHSFYSTDCRLTNIPDAIFEDYLETHDANGTVVTLGDPTSMGNGVANDGFVTTEKIENVVNLNVGDKGIVSLAGIENFIALEELYCFKNNLTTLNISTNTALTKFDCNKNELTSLNVTNNLLLTWLVCSNNNLTSLNVTQNTVLTKLSCYTNPIKNLDVSKNLLLEDLDCVENQLTSLNVTQNTALVDLQCYDNELTALDVSKNTKLKELYCASNKLVSLDVTKNVLLEDLECEDNPSLASLNIKNGNNVNLYLQTTNNPNLHCILVDDVYGTYLSTWRKDVQAYYSTDCRVTSIPDTVFEDYLETHDANGMVVPLGDPTSMGNGVANDNFVITEKIENVVNLNVSNKGIVSLTGIENFLALEELRCFKNNLTALDISNNTGLTYLNCSRNQLNGLDVSNNIALLKLSCYTNPIGSLDVTLNTVLESLDCVENELTTLNITQNTNLETLYSYDNELTSLDVSNNPKLVYLYTEYNQITSLDVSKNPLLEEFACSYNALTSLNIKNGNNTNLDTGDFDIRNNPNLTCVTVDDPIYAAANLVKKDVQTLYDLGCRKTHVPDTVFENYLETHDANGNTVSIGDYTSMGNGIADDNYVNTVAIEEVTLLFLQDNEIADLTGIADFTALETLICRRTKLTSIDVSANTNLLNLSFEDNEVSTIDLSSNIKLQQLICSNNPLKNIDVSANINLTSVSCINTELTNLNLSYNLALRSLRAGENKLTNLDLSTHNQLTQVVVPNNTLETLNVANGNNININTFDVTGNTNLTCIQVDNINGDFSLWTKDNTATYANYCDLTYVADANFENYLETHNTNGNVVLIGDATSLGNGIANDNHVATSKIELITILNIERQNIADLTGIEAFKLLESLNCDYNDLVVLDISSNTNLKILDAAENDLVVLDFSMNTLLEEINVRSNDITSLLVDNNPNLKRLVAGKNQLETLNVTSCSKLEELVVHLNFLLSIDIRNGKNNLITNFFATNNSNLTCIEVDDATAAYLTDWEKDNIASFSEDCGQIFWSGTNGTNWEEGNNWVNNLQPLSTSNVVIPNTTNTPIVNTETVAEVNNLTLAFLSSFDIADNGGVVVNGNLNANTNEAIKIKSSVNNSGVLLVKGTANGQVTYERGGLSANVWSIISAPVLGQSIKEFAENPINNIRKNTTVIPNRYAIGYYDDSKVAGAKWTYYTTDDLATNMLTFEKGKSYAISRETDGSVLFTGTLETENVTKSIVASAWNAVGNPYTTFLPINENGGANFISDNTSKLEPSHVGVYVWDNTQSKYIGKSLVTGESSLAPGQGFFVKTTTGVSDVIFNQAQRKIKALTGGNFSRSTTETKIPSIQLLAKSRGVTINTTIKYFDNATKGLDLGYDLGNYERASFDVFTRLLASQNSQNFTIQSLPNSGYEKMIIPIGIKSESESEISFSIKGLNFPAGVKVFIEDKKTNIFTKLDTEGRVTYNVRIKEKVNGIGRFYLHTTQNEPIIEVPHFNNIKIYTINNNKLIIKGITKGSFDVELYAINGVSVLRKTIEAKGENTINISNLQTGVYIVKIQSEQGKSSKKVIIN